LDSLLPWHRYANSSAHTHTEPVELFCNTVPGSVVARAFHRGGASCLLPPPLEMCEQCGSTISARPTRPVPIVDNAYPYPYGPYKAGAEDFYPDYIGTGDSHNLTSSQCRPIIHLPSKNGNCTGKIQVQVYPLVGSINNGTDINVRFVYGALCYANWGLNKRKGELLIKICGCAASLSPFSCLPPTSFSFFLYFHISRP